MPETQHTRVGSSAEDKVIFGGCLKDLRERAELSVVGAQVSLFNLGLEVSEQSWRNWEAGRALPPATMLVDIAEILDCSVDEILARPE